MGLPGVLGGVMDNVNKMNEELATKLDKINDGIEEQNDLLREILNSMNGAKA